MVSGPSGPGAIFMGRKIMLLRDDYLHISTKPVISDMDLIELIGFYEKYLCNRLFEYKTDNEEYPIINLRFEPNNLCHLLGFQHIFKGMADNKGYVGQRGYEKIENLEITMDTFKEKNLKRLFKSNKNRLLYFPFIYQIVHNPTAIFFSNNLLNTRIESEFMFYDKLDSRYLHLAVDSGKSSPYYFPKTFVDKKNDVFVKNQVKLNIVSIREILDE